MAGIGRAGKAGTITKGEPMTDEQVAELERIRLKDPDKILRPADIVDAARNKNSPLHGEFTWDNSEAAEKWRQEEARTLIRAFVTFEPRVNREARGYVSIPTDRVAGGGYRPTREVIASPALVSQLVEEVTNKVTSLREQYRHLKILDPLWLKIESCVKSFLANTKDSRAV